MNENQYKLFQVICRRNRWRCTAQRLAVFDFVHENYEHPDVDEVWKHVKAGLPTVTRESVYRILNEFSSRGIVRRLDLIERARYDGQVRPHGHFLCTHCGVIQDFAMPDSVAVPQNAFSGEVEHLELRVTGVCDRCKKKHKKPKESRS